MRSTDDYTFRNYQDSVEPLEGEEDVLKLMLIELGALVAPTDSIRRNAAFEEMLYLLAAYANLHEIDLPTAALESII